MKMDEDLEKCAIEAIPVVSSLCFHVADSKNKSGYHVNLRCDCGTKQVGSVHKSNKRPTFGDGLHELGRLIQQDHSPSCVAEAQELEADEKDVPDASTKRPPDEGVASLNTNEVLMLHRRLKIIQTRTV